MPNLTRTTLALLLLSVSTASADVVIRETVVHDTTTQVTLKLDSHTVLCSSADYGALFLKVLIPELAGITLLDHQNTGAGAPCVAAGPCQPGNMPSDIIGNSYEPTAINVKAIRIDEVDTTAQTCNTMLRETVDVTIAGKAFTHERYASLGERPVSDCMAAPAPAPNPSDRPTDDPGHVEEKTSSGGCDAGSSDGQLGFVLLALASLIVALRRR